MRQQRDPRTTTLSAARLIDMVVWVYLTVAAGSVLVSLLFR